MGSCNDNAIPATYYLPEDFQGVFAVVYSQKQGSEKIVDGRRQFDVSPNRIVLTSANFSDGWRDDVFLLKTKNGYDTLKMYLPNKDTTRIKFDELYYKMYTNDINDIAVNFRQIINSVPINNTYDECKFEYELITIGRASTLNDSIGKVFKTNLDKYLEDTLCRQNESTH
jgi:hypothetical protein